MNPRFGMQRGTAVVAALALALLGGGRLAAQDIDPVEMFPIDSPYTVTGICFHGGYLYAVTKNNVLLRYHPTSGSQQQLVEPLLAGHPHAHLHGLTVGAGDTFWVGDMHSARLYQFRFADYSLVSSLDAPPGNPTYGLAREGGILWAGHHSDDVTTPVRAVHPQTGEILQLLEFGIVDNHGMAWAGCRLWALDNATNLVYQVDDSGLVRDVFSLPNRPWYSFAFDGQRFWAGDSGMFYRLDLPATSPFDVTGDGVVDVGDLVEVIVSWGPCGDPPAACPADLDHDGTVDVADLTAVVVNWGPCLP